MKTVSTTALEHEAYRRAAHAELPSARDPGHRRGPAARAGRTGAHRDRACSCASPARCGHELVDALDVPQPLVSQHLRILKSAGVVAGERSGREVMYRLVDHHLAGDRGGGRSPMPPEDARSDVTPVRATQQRAAISALLDEHRRISGPAQELHDELRKRGEGIGLTTVLPHLCRRWPPPARSTPCAPTPANRSTGAVRAPSPSPGGAGSCGATVEVDGRRGRGVGRSGRGRARVHRCQPHHRDLRGVRLLRRQLTRAIAPAPRRGSTARARCRRAQADPPSRHLDDLRTPAAAGRRGRTANRSAATRWPGSLAAAAS